MSTHFFCKDDQGRIFDQKGNETMDWKDVNPFHLETLANVRNCYNSQGSEQEWIAEELNTKMQESAALAERLKKPKGHYHECSIE
ncbi:hypothetical protein RO3G_07167 [Rhizopus delemar RA 99-880]|uniref:Uncharacterized protein n=1 Tax=Rhizopus delemar (strain RA 99-880 / ATCC MYA-4621 / FGSC 9543 / NRRL 43880) TaxID=246409 RepID=I1C1Y2_RHIO9|nr:hypothetical protein RO3G_07167 [Rhizopus delemar RA 99-880]|eukprot:EIE82462.1 hypothetical protein RO3G_07167 [Rhizopus delemar RA 99-880]